MKGSSSCSSRQLWPCPIPASLKSASGIRSGRRRARLKLRVIIREHLRVYVATCNWLTQGRPKKFSGVRQPCSAVQSRMLDDLESTLRLFYRLSPGPSSGLDRSFGKFSSLSEALSELGDATQHLRRELDAYNPQRAPGSFCDSAADFDRADAAHSSSASAVQTMQPPTRSKQSGSSAMPIDPERIHFKQPPEFDPQPFITDPLLKSGFMNPVHLRTPQETWPKVRPAKVMCSREDLLKLFRKWDDVFCFRLLDAAASERKYRCGLFSVYKSDVKDRQIFNPIPENGRTLCMNASTVTLAHGSLLCGLFLDSHEDLIMGADDLEDFYHCFQVCYRKPFPRSDVLVLLCIDDLAVLQKVPRGIACDSESCPREDRRLLEKAGSAYKRVKLRTSTNKSIRDSFKCTILGGEVDGRRGTLSAPKLRILTLAKITLRLVSIGWASRHILETVIGCWIFILLFRRPLLSILNDVFHEGSGFSDRELLFQLSTGAKQELLLLAIWAPFAFTNLRAQPLDKLFCSDASLHGGGVCSASFSGAATLDLCRIAEQKGFYTRVDSSTLGKYMAKHTSGIVDPPEYVTEVPRVLAEGFIWDFAEVYRGSGHLSASHHAMGFRVHPGFDIQDGSTGDVLQPATILVIVGLIARRVVRAWHVAPVCTTFGTLRRPRLRSVLIPFGFNPDDDDTHEGNRFAMRGGFILWLCCFYNLVCSIEQPGGSVMYYLDIFQRLLSHGFHMVRFPFCGFGTPFQKLSCWISNNPHMTQLAARCNCGRKGRHFRVQGVFDHQRLREFCKMCRPSVEAVFGAAPQLGQAVAKFSAAYPLPLCKRIAQYNAIHFNELDDAVEPSIERPSSSPPRWVSELGRSLTWKKMLQFAFNKPNHININEHLSYRSLLKHLAKSKQHSRFCTLLDSRVVIGANAKGRKATVESRAGFSLDPTANRHPATNKRRDACYDSFCKWMEQELGIGPSAGGLPPHELPTALIAFGKHLFYSGAPKYFFAETINTVVYRHPEHRHFFSSAWATLRKWEEAEPTERAMVMPASVFEAGVALSLLWQWPLFAAALLMGFHGLLRPNEILPLKRSELVLPRDVLSCEQICYVKLIKSKTSRFMLRQHARISDELTVQFLDKQFGALPHDHLLFNCSFGMFKTRWNRLFGFMGVPTSEKQNGITPKSLRGSGASWLFHCAEDVSRILWRGRWQSRRTLEHYLQDVMGQVLLTDLPPDKRADVLDLSLASSHLLVAALG
eukprot:Skav218715  [mRNA]  locus=scaffold1346:664540:668773:+ [translate_table: standard]